MTQPPIISTANLCKSFHTTEIETLALSDINLQIMNGEFVSISGHSGGGKSTLLSILGVLDTPTSGKYLLNNIEVSGLSHAEKAALRNSTIGFIFQAFNLISDLSIFENVELPLKYRKDISRQDREQLVLEALNRVEMSHRVNHKPAQLSGGQQQRVAIARAIAGSPKVLFADEPTGNLDSENAEQVMNIIAELHRSGSTICMVTHEPALAMRANRHIVLSDGKVISDNIIQSASIAAIA